ncbi:hypothetical protein JQ615_09635 [Bradyrhizobium jicamae]|uniref:Uncharacterized protein n=1 Tax=Bradyrhizobium jicamae TaxID=280332 RepID=A0ABS5FFS9_9BRAD|nr:hypothetical protein [Bradyrhizobium jicamae]MBR0795648.1 hypothetical protein [Bradyrhizobium jicamae]
MGNNSTKVDSLKVIQGGKAEVVKPTKALTHKDIKAFLAKFAEAILVDQERVNKLPRKQFHPDYDNGMWKRNREAHVDAIVDLSMTVDRMPKRLLKRLTELATAYRPEVVKQPLLNIISDLATRVRSPWLYETASLFFNELIKDVSRQDPCISSKGSPLEMMLRWFDYDDPIQIAQDPECEYVGLLASHIKRESDETKHVLAARGKHAFIEMRVTREFCDDLLPRRPRGP